MNQTRDEMIDRAIEVLNRALRSDLTAINQLMGVSIPCNASLADDPTIQVGISDSDSDSYHIRPFGLVNGLFGIWKEGFAHIVMVLNDQNEIIKFRRSTEDDLAFSQK